MNRPPMPVQVSRPQFLTQRLNFLAQRPSFQMQRPQQQPPRPNGQQPSHQSIQQGPALMPQPRTVHQLKEVELVELVSSVV
jgi:hypothetical protein